jgi:hypothetical protein
MSTTSVSWKSGSGTAEASRWLVRTVGLAWILAVSNRYGEDQAVREPGLWREADSATVSCSHHFRRSAFIHYTGGE